MYPDPSVHNLRAKTRSLVGGEEFPNITRHQHGGKDMDLNPDLQELNKENLQLERMALSAFPSPPPPIPPLFFLKT